MRWPAFLARFGRRAASSSEQIRILDEHLEERLRSRKADRAMRQERARRGAATKVHQALVRDRLRNESVTF